MAKKEELEQKVAALLAAKSQDHDAVEKAAVDLASTIIIGALIDLGRIADAMETIANKLSDPMVHVVK